MARWRALTDFSPSNNGHPRSDDESPEQPAIDPDPAQRPMAGRIVAVIEVLLCSERSSRLAIGRRPRPGT
jgi:hypothetical protein